MMNKFVLSIILSTILIICPEKFHFQSNNTIRGKIIDSQSLEPLAFANISFKDTKIGTTSDLDGKFSTNNSVLAEELIISYVGYKTISVDLRNYDYQKELIVFLNPINIYLQEVTVYSAISKQDKLTEISSLSMQSDRIREISVGMPDILRSIQALPGISVNNEFKADFNVRGGNQDENLILVNGTQVYEPYHIKEAANASVGVFNVDLIKKVDLITGGFSARYGDKMSSVLNIEYREGDREKYSGAASLSLAYLDGYFEGPITKNSSFLFGIRKSYMEYVLSMIDYEDISSVQPSFYDIQGVLSYHFSPTNRLLFEFIHAGDDFSYLPFKSREFLPYIGSFKGQDAAVKASRNENEDNDATYFSNMFDLQSINVLSSKTLLKAELSYYQQADNEYRLFKREEKQEYSTLITKENFFDNLFTQRFTFDTLKIRTFEFKTDLAYQFSHNYEINFGLSYQNINYNENLDDIWTYIRTNNFNNSSIEVSDTIIRRGVFGEDEPIDVNSDKFSSFLENVLQLGNYLTINLGGRADYFDLIKDFNFSPRISAAYSLTENTFIRGAWGYFYQTPTYKQLITSEATDTNTQSQLAIHYILGIEHSMFLSNSTNNFFKVKLEGYYKEYKDLISSYFGVFERITYSKRNDAIGSAKGIDFHTILNLNRFYLWISYGLLYANENKINDDRDEYPRYTDQRHTISFISRLDLGAKWSFSLKGYYGSGFPYTPRTAYFEDGSWYWKSGEIHSAHLPAYKRIDIRLSKDFNFSKSELNVFIDVSNVFNFKNIQNYEYKTPGFTKPSPEEVLLWPILPSLGIRYKF